MTHGKKANKPMSTALSNQSVTLPKQAPEVTHLLLADDDRIVRDILAGMLEQEGYEVTQVANGQEAYTWLTQNPTKAEIVLLDREMPGLDGLSVVRLMRQNAQLASMPVVMVTAADKPQQVEEGLASGVYYYLTKPVVPQVLSAVSAAAVQEARRRRALTRQLEQQRNGFALLTNAQFKFTTLAQAEQLAMVLAPAFPNPSRALTGLVGLLSNAVEHGRLGIGYKRKGELLESGLWLTEVERLQNLPENAGKVVEVRLERVANRCKVSIADPGTGFDWRSFLELSPDRASARHGRGIAQARAASFDSLSYNAAGNVVVAEAGSGPELEW